MKIYMADALVTINNQSISGHLSVSLRKSVATALVVDPPQSILDNPASFESMSYFENAVSKFFKYIPGKVTIGCLEAPRYSESSVLFRWMEDDIR